MRQLIEEGHRIRSEYSVQGKQAKADKQQELVNLGPKREALQQKKDELMVTNLIDKCLAFAHAYDQILPQNQCYTMAAIQSQLLLLLIF